MTMNSTDKTLIRDMASHWVPTLIFALIGYLWFDATSTLRTTDVKLFDRIERLAETQKEIQIQVARLDERMKGDE